MTAFGVQAGLDLVISILVLIITWWAIQLIKWDVFLKSPSSARAKILVVLITVAITYCVSSFIISYVSWSIQLPQIYK